MKKMGVGRDIYIKFSAFSYSRTMKIHLLQNTSLTKFDLSSYLLKLEPEPDIGVSVIQLYGNQSRSEIIF